MQPVPSLYMQGCSSQPQSTAVVLVASWRNYEEEKKTLLDKSIFPTHTLRKCYRQETAIVLIFLSETKGRSEKEKSTRTERTICGAAAVLVSCLLYTSPSPRD